VWVIWGPILAFVILDSIFRRRHPEEYQEPKQRRDWRAKGREW